jgi:hypothetical protein
LAGAQEVRNQSDQALVRRFAESNDEAAFEALLRGHGPMVLAVCRRVLGKNACPTRSSDRLWTFGLPTTSDRASIEL